METHSPKAVFLSYASQDAEAARRIAEALRPAGVEVWFDQEGGLEHGDEWDAKIRHQIKECVLFIPLISANTQARLEGYFRIEWELATERAMGIAHGVPFILPVVIDDTREPEALVPERFHKVQWMRLPGGTVTPEAQARFLKLWSHRTGALHHAAVKVGAGTGADRSAAPPPRAETQGLPTVVVGLEAGARVLGRYVLVREVGRGGMGVVWLARDEELLTDVALKFVHEAIARDQEALDLLRHETRTARTLSHPHILKVHDFVVGGGRAAISMEYFDARTLNELKTTQPGRCFAADQLAPWLRQLCGALDYAHTDARVIHRDLKPANLMMDETGRLKVTDFGIAHRLAERGLSRLTGRAGFTLTYASPQQLRGNTPTVADDIYALGATLYELLTGEPPFYQGDLFNQVQQLAPAPLTARRAELAVRTEPTTLLPPIPPEWEETVLACLAKEPKDRPQSAGEVAARLGLTAGSAGAPERGTALPPAPAAPAADQRGTQPGAAARLVEPRQRHPVLQTALGLAAAVALAGLGWLYFGGAAPEPPPVIAAQERGPAPAEPARTGADDARGGLVVHTTPPGADVAVGGLTGEKSPATIKDVRPGRHPVIIRLAGYEDERIEAEVKENEFVTINVTLTRSTGALQIASVPSWLEVAVKDRKAEVKEQMLKTPAKLEKLPTGDYELTFRREGWPDQKQTVLVKRNETVTAQAEFEAGALEITSVPSGAEVWRQGKRLGVTPVRQDGLVPGSYGLELRLKGYEAATHTGEVRARQTTRVAVALARIPTPEAGRVWTIPDLGLVMQPIPAGTFAMGDDRAANDGRESMTPVTISRAFWLGRTEVTQREWLAIMEGNPSRFLGEDRPVERVPWEAALDFCRRLTARERAAGRLPEGYAYTLPTEAQWEYACRAGTTGEFAGDVDAMVWHAANSGNETHPVGQKQANAWGLCDMHGNAMEWCLAGQGGREGGGVTDASGPSTDQSLACRRGGSFFNTAGSCRSGFRRKDPANATMSIGVRLALNAGP